MFLETEKGPLAPGTWTPDLSLRRRARYPLSHHRWLKPFFQFSIFNKDKNHFPLISVGDVIRVHRMMAQDFNGAMTGRVFDSRAVTVVSGSVGDPIIPVSEAKSFTFTEFDKARVEELRAWWKAYNAVQLDDVRLFTENVP